MLKFRNPRSNAKIPGVNSSQYEFVLIVFAVVHFVVGVIFFRDSCKHWSYLNTEEVDASNRIWQVLGLWKETKIHH